MDSTSVSPSALAKSQLLLRDSYLIISSNIEIYNNLTKMAVDAKTKKDDSTNKMLTDLSKKLLNQLYEFSKAPDAIISELLKKEPANSESFQPELNLPNGYAYNGLQKGASSFTNHHILNTSFITRRRTLWVYTDSKLDTDSCLIKLKRDLQDHSEISMTSLERVSSFAGGHFDAVILFCYIAGGRENSERLETDLAFLKSALPHTPLHVIVLRDVDAKTSSVDTSKVPHELFHIFTDPCSYTKLCLYMDKPRNNDQKFSDRVSENYRILLERIKSLLH